MEIVFALIEKLFSFNAMRSITKQKFSTNREIHSRTLGQYETYGMLRFGVLGLVGVAKEIGQLALHIPSCVTFFLTSVYVKTKSTELAVLI